MLAVALAMVRLAAATLEVPGLALDLDPATGAVIVLRAGDEHVDSPTPAAVTGFLVEDVAAGTPPEPARGAMNPTATGASLAAVAPAAHLEVSAAFSVHGGSILVSAVVKDTTGSDRAIVLRFRLPVDSARQRWTWDDDAVSSRAADRDGLYENTQKLNHDHITASRWASRYPLCALHAERVGLSLAVPLDPPRVYTLRYVRQGGAGFLEVALGFGLSPGTLKFPSQASFAFALFPHDPAWGFRSALELYYRLYPDSFRTAASKAGLWFINTDPESHERPWDFHFSFRTPALTLWLISTYDHAQGVQPFDGCQSAIFTQPSPERLGFFLRAPPGYTAKSLRRSVWRPGSCATSRPTGPFPACGSSTWTSMRYGGRRRPSSGAGKENCPHISPGCCLAMPARPSPARPCRTQVGPSFAWAANLLPAPPWSPDCSHSMPGTATRNGSRRLAGLPTTWSGNSRHPLRTMAAARSTT
jgi:hypothetical protein